MFVNSNEGYKKVPFTGSINDFCYEIGYNTDQVHTFLGAINHPKIFCVCLEVFTLNVLFVVPSKDVDNIQESDVKSFLKDFDYKHEYSSYNTKNILENGADYKTLKIDFLARVLNIKNPDENGMFYVPSIGYNLFFIDGYLTDIQTSDGLNDSAKHLKDLNPTLFRDYENEAKRYWGNDFPKVINEVNKQFDALFWIPHGLSNEFIKLHKNHQGFINFHMLKVYHYTKSIALADFLEINHGRYKEVKPMFSFKKTPNKKYTVGRFTYEFSENGELIQFHSN